MIYLKTLIAGILGAFSFLVVRSFLLYFRTNKVGIHPLFNGSSLMWIGLLVCFFLGAGLYHEFHGVVFYTALIKH